LVFDFYVLSVCPIHHIRFRGETKGFAANL